MKRVETPYIPLYTVSQSFSQSFSQSDHQSATPSFFALLDFLTRWNSVCILKLNNYSILSLLNSKYRILEELHR